MTDSSINNICQGKCDTATGREYCTGCGRHWKDIAHWTEYSDEKKLDVIREISQRKGK